MGIDYWNWLYNKIEGKGMKYTVKGMKRDEEYPDVRELETTVEQTNGVRHWDLLAVIDWTQTRPGVEWIVISWEEEKEI